MTDADDDPTAARDPSADADLERVRAAKAGLKQALADVPGVKGVGIGPGGDHYDLVVRLREDADADADAVPAEFDGVPVRTQVVGEISAL